MHDKGMTPYKFLNERILVKPQHIKVAYTTCTGCINETIRNHLVSAVGSSINKTELATAAVARILCRLWVHLMGDAPYIPRTLPLPMLDKRLEVQNVCEALFSSIKKTCS